jgi:hypothetical protein
MKTNISGNNKAVPIISNNNQLGDIHDANVLTIYKAVHTPMRFVPNKAL